MRSLAIKLPDAIWSPADKKCDVTLSHFHGLAKPSTDLYRRNVCSFYASQNIACERAVTTQKSFLGWWKKTFTRLQVCNHNYYRLRSLFLFWGHVCHAPTLTDKTQRTHTGHVTRVMWLGLHSLNVRHLAAGLWECVDVHYRSKVWGHPKMLCFPGKLTLLFIKWIENIVKTLTWLEIMIFIWNINFVLQTCSSKEGQLCSFSHQHNCFQLC